MSFRDDRSVVRRVTVEFHVPEQAPVFRGDDGQAYRLVPLSVMRRKTLVNFEHRVSHPEIGALVHQVVSGSQEQLAAAYESLTRGAAAPVVLDLADHCMFRAILDRLADNFVLWVMIPAGAPRRRLLTFSCDEPLHLRYREPGFQGKQYRLGEMLGFWRPPVWTSALGLTATRIEFPVPAAENTDSFHFEIDAPKGVQITEASLLAGRPGQARLSLDHGQGGFPPSACDRGAQRNSFQDSNRPAGRHLRMADSLHAVSLGCVRAPTCVRHPRCRPQADR